jgi:uncharacterized protein (TIGR00251 family)
LADVPWLVGRADGVELVVHARPGAKRSAVAGLHGAALCVRIAARPLEGAANLELVRVLAEVLGVSRSAVALRAGAHGRNKRLHVSGLSTTEVLSRLQPHL